MASCTALPPPSAKRAGLSFRERGELRKMEARIEAAEAPIARLQARPAWPQCWSGPQADGAELTTELAAEEAAVAALYARWEELLQRA